jgi:putative transposase
MSWIDRSSLMSVNMQCILAQVSRSTFYARHEKTSSDDEVLLLQCRLIDEEYTRHPFYGSRRMVAHLRKQGHIVNRKRVQKLMRMMCLAGMAPGPNTSSRHPEHKVHPYLLRDVAVVRPNQAGLFIANNTAPERT